MRYPWANTLILVLVAAELVTGAYGLVTGSPDRAVFVLLHRVFGYALVLLLVWKGALVIGSLQRRRSGPPRYASVVLLVGLLTSLALGIGWSLAGPFGFWLFSGLSWHIYVGAALVPVLAWHTLHFTRRLPLSYWADRRSFLRLAGLAVGGLALTQYGEAAARTVGLSSPGRRFTGSYPPPKRYDGGFPVVSWFNDRPPQIDRTSWRLTVGGAVRNEITLAYDDLASTAEVMATIDCTGGWYSEEAWSGRPLAELLKAAGPSSQASSITVTSATGYYRRFSLDEAEGYMLATRVGGAELSRGHGFPARLVAPGKRGFEWVKWVTRIDVNESPKWLQPPLPLQ